MPLEVEAKLRVGDHDPVRARLRALGATFLLCVLEENTLFDRPDGALRRAGCGLRVRSARNEEDGTMSATLTFKGPVLPGPFKRREELEVEVADAEAMGRLLDGLGFTVILRYQKRRESWRHGDCRVELDEAPRLGRFVEIEGPDEDAISRVRTALDLAAAPIERKSYVAMMLDHCRKAGLAEAVVTFDNEV